MASVSQHCEKTDSETLFSPVTRYTQNMDIMPTLCVTVSFGQWYPEELQSSSCQTAGDSLLNDCSLGFGTEMPSSQDMVSPGRRVSSTSAAKNDANCRSKQSVSYDQSEQRRTWSRVKTEQRQRKSDISLAVPSSPSKYSRLSSENAVGSEKCSNSRSVRINRPDRVGGVDKHADRVSRRMSSAKASRSVTGARENHSYIHHTSQSNNSDVRKSVARSNVTEMCRLTSGTETHAADNTRTFQSAAVNKYKTAEETRECSDGKLINFAVKLQPLLEWADAFAIDSVEHCDDLPEEEMAAVAQSYDGIGYSEALVESVGHGGTEGLKSGSELPSSDNTFENTPSNKDDICELCLGDVISNTASVRIKCENFVSRHDSTSDQNDNSSSISGSSNHLQIQVGNSMNEKRCYNKTHIYPGDRNYTNSSIFNVNTLSHRRCFSCDNICTCTDVDVSLFPLSASTDAVHTGGPVGTRATVMQCGSGGRDRLALTEAEAVVLGAQGVTDCLDLPPAGTWRYEARLTDASHLLSTSADHSEPCPQLTLLTDELGGEAGVRMETDGNLESAEYVWRQEHLRSNCVVVGCGAVDAETGAGWPCPAPPDQSESTTITDKSPPPLQGDPLRAAADIPTAACSAAAAADNTASYFAELQLCLPPLYPADFDADLVMGQVESSTDDVKMQKNTVESLDISSTLAVSLRGVADTTSRSAGQPYSPGFVAWSSLLNPTRSDRSGRDVLTACGEGRSTATADDQRDVGGQLSSDTLGCPSRSAVSHQPQPAPCDLCELTWSAREDDKQLAVDTQPPVAARDQLTRSSACERDVDTDRTCRQQAETDAVSHGESEESGVEYTDDGDASVTGKEARCSSLSEQQQNSPLSSQQSAPRRAGSDDSWPARDKCASAAVSAGVTGERLPSGQTLDAAAAAQQQPPPPPPGAITAAVGPAPSLTKSDRRLTCALDQPTANKPVSDDVGQVENIMAAALDGSATVASDVASADAVGSVEQAFSASPSGCDIDDHVSADNDTIKSGGSVPVADDGDVDRKLAVELERLKNLVVISPKSCTDHTATSASHRLNPEEPRIQDIDGDYDFSSDDNRNSLRLPFVAKVARETAESALECCSDEFEHPDTVEQTADDTPCEGAAGLYTNHKDDDEETRMRTEAVADDNITASSELSTDNLSPASSAVEQLQVMDGVSYMEEHTDSAVKQPHSDAVVHVTSADNAAAVTEQPTLSPANGLSSADSVSHVLSSAANMPLADVIREAELSVLSFLGVYYNTPYTGIYRSDSDLSKSAITCNTHSVLPDIVQESQTFVNDATEATEPRGYNLLKCKSSHTVCTHTCQNYSLKLPCNVSLGDKASDLSVKGTARGESLERNEMAWSELKVLAEMLYAEQRLLMQLDSTCLQLQVAYCCYVWMVCMYIR